MTTQPPQTVFSDYMHWAKTQQACRYNLANSGLTPCPRDLLPLQIEDIELSGMSTYGWPPLQAALSRHLNVPEACIVHATGTSFANHLAMAAILSPGDEVLVEHPTYELLLATAGYFRVGVRRIPRRFEDGFGLDLELLKRSLSPQTRLVVLTNLHNPSSAFLERNTLQEAARLAWDVGAYLLVDEVYLESAFELSPQTSFVLADNIIVTNSLTKVYGLSGLRCGWILAPQPLAERMWRLNDLFGVIPAHAAERLSVLAFEHFSILRKRARAILDANRLLWNQFCLGRSDLECRPLDFGTVVFPRVLNTGVASLCEILRNKYETTVVPGHFFEMPEHIRVGLGREPAEFSEGLQRLGSALDDLTSAKGNRPAIARQVA